MAGEYHNPVLLKECIDGLNVQEEGVYADVTFGGGGHSKEIIKHLTTGCLYAFEQDEDAERNKIDDKRFVLIKQNFRNLIKLMGLLQIWEFLHTSLIWQKEDSLPALMQSWI
jgi:16S rRNA (cytosine1402-N4)-methyltransferase